MSPFPSISPVYSTNRFQRVHPVDKIIGVELLLATDDEDKVNLFALLTRVTFLSVFFLQVVIKTFPIIPEPIRIERPAWRFTPILRD